MIRDRLQLGAHLICVAISCTPGALAGAEEKTDPSGEQESLLEIREAVLKIKADIESSDVAGLQAMHLNSPKFSKFGPRSFERQDVESTNESEARFFSSISDASYEIHDLKIDVFGNVGVATYYPKVSFVRGSERVYSNGRQTLVFLRTEAGWKLVHEHGTSRPVPDEH